MVESRETEDLQSLLYEVVMFDTSSGGNPLGNGILEGICRKSNEASFTS